MNAMAGRSGKPNLSPSNLDPNANEQRIYSKEATNSKAKLTALRQKLFPTWNSYAHRTYDRIVRYGPESDSVTLGDLLLIYAGAQKLEKDYAKKEDFLPDLEEWKQKGCNNQDLHEFTRLFSKQVGERLASNKVEILGEINPKMAAMQREINELRNDLYKLRDKTNHRDVVDREIVVTAPDPDWDLTKPFNDIRKAVIDYFQPFYPVRELEAEMIEKVGPVQAAPNGDKRYSVIFKTLEIRQEICYRGEIKKEPKASFRRGRAPDERDDKVKRFPFAMASAKFNYESQEHKYPIFSRVERDRKTGHYKIQTYASNEKQVSRVAAQARAGTLTDPKLYKKEEHEKLLPAFN